MVRFVVIDLTGKVLADIPIRPATDPPRGAMRFVEHLEWLPDGKIRVDGSLNPCNCEQFDLDLATGEESNWVGGECGTFRPSPDGKHMAKREVVCPAEESHAFNRVVVDERPDPASPIHATATVSYFGEGDPDGIHDGILVLAGPVWSPDSRSVAVIEKRASTGEVALTILPLAGGVHRVPIPTPSGKLDDASLNWFGSKVVVGRGVNAIAIDSATRRFDVITPEISDRLKRSARARDDAEATRKRVEAVVRQLGGREGIVLSGSASQ